MLETVDDWPRRYPSGSGLGPDKAKRAFAETVEGLAADLRGRRPEVFASARAGDWPSLFVYELIEAHATYFAEPRRGAGGKPVRAYDAMALAFPPAARLVPALLLGRAIDAGAAQLDALEPVILLRKQPRSEHPRIHLHAGKANCGATLNTMALVGHCTVGGETRCVVLGSQPLSRHESLDLSAPRAIKHLLALVDQAGTLASATRAGDVLLDAPVVVGLLQGGGPRGKSAREAVNAELVPARSARVLSAIVTREARLPKRLPRPLALQLPTDPPADEGPHRLQPNGIEPAATGWPQDPIRFAAAIACAAPTAGSRPSQDVEWVVVPAALTQMTSPIPVTLLGRRSVGSDARATVWLVDGRAADAAQTAIETVRRAQVLRNPGDGLTSIWDAWVMRAYRRHAAGDLLIKGSSTEQLSAGVGAALNAAFVEFALRDGPA